MPTESGTPAALVEVGGDYLMPRFEQEEPETAPKPDT
jgi:hypothetical protein